MTPSGFKPTDLANCTVWLDASRLGLTDGQSLGSTWPDLSGGSHHGAVFGSPAPVARNNAPNGKSVVRFSANEGTVRGDTNLSASGLPMPGYNFTVVVVCRMVGTPGRMFSSTYPGANLAMPHPLYENSCYDNGWAYAGGGWGAMPRDWQFLSYTGQCTQSDLTDNTTYYRLNGTYLGGVTSGGGGLQGRYNLSGYDATGSQETGDFEVAELIIYDRALTDTERQQVEQYVYAKWWGEGGEPEPVAVAAEFSGGGALSATATPRVTVSATLSDDFNRPDDVATIGPNWTPRLGALATASNGAYPINTTFWAGDTFVTPLATDDVEVTVTVGAHFGDTSAEHIGVVLGANEAGQSVLGIFHKARLMIVTQTNWGSAGTFGGQVNQYQFARPAFWSPGDRCGMRRTGATYQLIYNGDPLPGAVWTDVTNVVPRDASHRLVGAYTATVNAGSWRSLDAWDGHDLVFAGGGSLSATVTAVTAAAPIPVAAAFSGGGSLSATVEGVAFCNTLTTGNGTLSATAVKVLKQSATLDIQSDGTLSAVGREVYARAGQAAGSGALSGVLVGNSIHTRTADHTGQGALSGAVKKVAPIPASLAGGGTLTGGVRAVRPAALALLSTGQLQAVVTIDGREPPPPFVPSWTPSPVVPVSRHGPSWTLDGGSTATLVKPGGWFALLEKVSPHNGTGTLATLLAPRYKTGVALDGAGSLATDLVIRRNLAVGFSGLGLPTATMYPLVAGLTVDFTGSGLLSSELNDGLAASVQPGLAAGFAGGGALVTDVAGGVTYVDGLSASVVPRYLFPIYFTGVGQLLAYSGEVSAVFAALIGDGALTSANLEQIYPMTVAMAGTGALSAGALAAYKTLVEMLGSGTLDAQLFAKYLTSVGFQGAGAFTALLLASYTRSSPSGGVGTVTALIAQRYNLFPAFNGSGYLGYDIEGTVNSEEVDAQFEGDGAFDAEAYGLVNEMFAILSGTGSFTPKAVALYQQLAALSGRGTLTAAMKASYQRLAALVGSGSLTMESFVKYAKAMGLDGAGALMALMWELEQSSISTGGTGTIAVTMMQRYPMDVGFSGGGTLSALVFDATYPDGLSARVGRSYGAFLTGDGVLTAGAYRYQIASATALSGGGTLSAALVKVQIDLRSAALSGDGALGATAMRQHPMAANLSGGGTLSASYTWSYNFLVSTVSPSSGAYDTTVTITGAGFSGVSSVTIGGQAVRNLSVVNDTTITCNPPGLANGTYDVVVTSATAGAITKTGAFAYSYTPVTETNTARTNQAMPVGSRGCYVTLLGAGGGGGIGFYSPNQNRGGGGGGGGAAKVERVFVDRSLMAGTYTVARPLGGASQANGGAASFASGSVSISAGGGGAGGNGTQTLPGTAGTGGVASASGVTATLRNGTAGGAGGAANAGAGQAAPNNTTGSAPGGGGGMGFSGLGSGSTGGKGGDSANASGGAQKGTGGGAGNAGGSASAGLPGGGGGGATNVTFQTTGNAGGAGGDQGAGGGGGSPTNNSGSPGAGGAGGDSYTLVEWV